MKILNATLVVATLLVNINAFGQSAIDSTEKINWIRQLNSNEISLRTRGTYCKASAGFALYMSNTKSIQVPYWVYVPKSYQPDVKTPLIVFLHGGVTGRAGFSDHSYALTKEPIFSLANKYGYIVLYPFAKNDFGWVKQPDAFGHILIDIKEVKQKYNIDKQNIFLGGMSDGGSATFWFITNKKKIFKSFFSISGYPKLYNQKINFKNITKKRSLHSINAIDDDLMSFSKLKLVYKQHKSEAEGWDFDSVRVGGHGFIYDNEGVKYMDDVLNKLSAQAMFLSNNKIKFNNSINLLDSISVNDQFYRVQMGNIREAYGGNSDQMKHLVRKINETDSLNLLTVIRIIDNYGWPDPNLVGSERTHTLFMVIQHSDLKTQQRYLPLLRAATNNRMLSPASLALLEDRVALREGRKQIYGSQISWNLKTNKYMMMPLMDPDNVDKRRAQVGLEPLTYYVKDCCNMAWDVEQYKKEQFLHQKNEKD